MLLKLVRLTMGPIKRYGFTIMKNCMRKAFGVPHSFDGLM
jgi:hypothetical protein